MKALELAVLVGVVAFVIYLVYRESKESPPPSNPTPAGVVSAPRIIHSHPPRSGPQWVSNSASAPPLPLSTMYSIRIGREVTSRGGPGDMVWDYDHGRRMTGPRY